MERLILSFPFLLGEAEIPNLLGELDFLPESSKLTRMAVGGVAGVTFIPGEEAGVSDLLATWEMTGESRRPETDLLEDSVSTDLLRLSLDTTFKDFSPETGGVTGELCLGDLRPT